MTAHTHSASRRLDVLERDAPRLLAAPAQREGLRLDLTCERARQIQARMLDRGCEMVIRDDTKIRKIAGALGIDLSDYPSACNSATANARARAREDA